MYIPKRKKPLKFDYDLIVLGTGAGGGVAAHALSKAGRRVAVIEPDAIGGECPNYGCVPTKALLQAAENYRIAKDSKQFGIRATSVTARYPSIKAWKDTAVRHTGTYEGAEFYAHEHMKLVRGAGHFLDPWTVSVHGKRYTAKNFLIATGTKSVIPPIPGLSEVGFITYREAIDLIRPPRSLFVIGGGAIGCEFTELFSTFGTKVQIADIAPRLIGLEDPEVGALVESSFAARGIQVHLNSKIVRIVKKGAYKQVYYEQNGVTHHTVVEEILLSSGKAPNTDIGLENAGVLYNKGGIQTAPTMQTSVPHIYAAGDVVGPYRFTHMAAYQSRVVAHNLLERQKQKVHYHAVPRCVFIEPEIACVGQTEQQLNDKNIPYQIGIADISVTGRANTSNVTEGFVKVIASKRGRLLGASIVSPRAGEVIHELGLAIQHHMKATAVLDTIHAFPTWSEAVRLACAKIKCV